LPLMESPLCLKEGKRPLGKVKGRQSVAAEEEGKEFVRLPFSWGREVTRSLVTRKISPDGKGGRGEMGKGGGFPCHLQRREIKSPPFGFWGRSHNQQKEGLNNRGEGTQRGSLNSVE